jgi:hypothetical protein
MNRSRKPRVVYSEEEMLRWKAERERLERTVIEQAAEITLIKKTGFRVEGDLRGRYLSVELKESLARLRRLEINRNSTNQIQWRFTAQNACLDLTSFFA